MEQKLKAIKDDLLYLNDRLDKVLDSLSKYKEEGDIYSYDLSIEFIEVIKLSFDRIYSRYLCVMEDIQDDYIELLFEFISFKMKDFI